MDARSRWRRLDAEHWVHVAGVVLTTVLVLCTFWTALAGWLTSAWRREQPWSWWEWTVLATLSFLSELAALADPRPVRLAGLVVSGGLLLLLAHPDSRTRIQPPAPTSTFQR